MPEAGDDVTGDETRPEHCQSMPTDDVRSMVRRESVLNHGESGRGHHEHHCPVGHHGTKYGHGGLGLADYLAKANDETLLDVLIEDVVAIENLAEIVAVDNIDVFSVAPGDLAQSMGYIGQTDHPAVAETIDKAIKQIISAGKVAGALVHQGNVEAYINKGARFLSTTWLPWLHAGAGAYLDKVSKAS